MKNCLLIILFSILTFGISAANTILDEPAKTYNILSEPSIDLPATGEVEEDDIIYVVETANNTAYCKGLRTGINSKANVVIKDNVEFFGNTYPVTSIADKAFNGKTGLTGDLTIGNNVITIGEKAFYNCKGFNGKLTLGENLQTIRENAFYYTSFTGPLVIPDKLEEIGNSAFYGCSGLTQINLSGVTLGNNAFRECIGLKSLDIDCETIPQNCFYGCNNIESIKFGSNTKKILSNNFNNCLITELRIPGSVTTLGSNGSVSSLPFNGCVNLKSLIFENGEDPLEMGCYYSTSNRGQGMFYGLNIEEITLGRNIIYKAGSYGFDRDPYNYGYSAFYSLKYLSNLTITETVTEIHPYLFYYCEALKTITINNSHINRLGDNAFSYCTSLETLDLGQEVEIIENNVFNGCKGLKNIRIGERVETIGNGAFQGCNLLQSIDLGKNVKEIKNRCFSGCQSLTEIIIPSSVIKLGDRDYQSGTITSSDVVFNNCTSLKRIVFEDGDETLTFMGSMLSSCPIEEIYIGRNMGSTPIGGKNTLIKATIGPKVTSLNDNYFSRCSNLEVIDFIDSQLSVLPAWCFNYCTSLTAITVPSSVKEIKEMAFNRCSQLKDVKLGDNLQIINNGVFNNCSALEEIVIPSSTVQIGNPTFSLVDLVFEDCISLKKFIIEDSEKTLKLGTYVNSSNHSSSLFFNNCPLEEVYIGRNITFITEPTYDYEYETNPRVFQYSPFYGISTIKKVELGSLVSKVLIKEFDGCVNLSEVYSYNPVPPNCYGSDSFTDPTKHEGTLYVPMQAISDYQAAPVWEEFFNILPLPNLPTISIEIEDSYESTCTHGYDKVKVGDSLQLTVKYDSPDFYEEVIKWESSQKEIATVNGDSGIVTALSPGTTRIYISSTDNPQLSAYLDLEVFDALAGDANDSEKVNIADVMVISEFVVENPVESWCHANADADGDGKVDSNDITATVNIMLGKEPTATSPAGYSTRSIFNDYIYGEFTKVSASQNNLSIFLNNMREYTTLQADIILPDGCTIDEVVSGQRAKGHNLAYNVTEKGVLKVVLFSLSNASFIETEGALLEIRGDFSDLDQLSVSNIYASDSNAQQYSLEFERGTSEGTTSVDGINAARINVSGINGALTISNAQGLEVFVYSVDGKLIQRFTATDNSQTLSLAKGIYVVRIGNQSFKILLK